MNSEGFLAKCILQIWQVTLSLLRLFLFNYAGVLDYYDKYDHKKSYIRSVLLHDSRNKTLGRALR